MQWNPFNIADWSQALGMANVPWLSASAGIARTNHAVLLDGAAASLAVWAGDDPGFNVFEEKPLSWAWSSNLRHLVVLNRKSGELFVRRWDEPREQIRIRVPATPAEANDTLDRIAKHKPRAADVITQMIVAFKLLRGSLSVYGDETNLATVRAFNLLITGAAKNANELERCRTVGDVLDFTENHHEELRKFQFANIEETIAAVTRTSPAGVPPLDPHFLIRHAAGQLYQEAHFELERSAAQGQQSLFGGLAPNRTSKGTNTRRDARFTPSPLARSLVEQGLKQIADSTAIDILDPACGSGVFLHEALRELDALCWDKPITLRGFDTSPVSVEFAKFCLESAAKEARESGMNVTVEIKLQDALDADWGHPNAVLMNPPFVSYRDMEYDDREKVRNILGPVARGHFDKSMAFLWKAALCLPPGGVLASVLPAVLLDSSYGDDWRRALLDRMRMTSIGRFRGYSYFPGALVEPAFVVMSNPVANHPPAPLTTLIADEGCEDRALREIRRRRAWTSTETEGISVSMDRSPIAIGSASWIPKSARHESLVSRLRHLPTVGQFFDVNQGALTGNNEVFVLTASQYSQLPEPEKAYFRPAAGTTTIIRGSIERSEFVFFPYGEQGLTIQSEQDLEAAVPHYFRDYLIHAREKLRGRSDKTENWWELIRARTWQWIPKPKILTAYFGTSGHFAYDDKGEFVCLHGYAWNPKQPFVTVSVETDEEPLSIQVPFHETDYPWTCIAIMNSKPFSVLLSSFCPQVQGGQFNLSKRFIKDVPLPDLSSEVPGDMVAELAEIGKTMGIGREVSSERLDSLVARAYGMPLSEWNGN